MKPALVLLGYAIVVSWLAPAPLTRLTAAGVNPRLGLITWLVAIVSTLASVAMAISFLVRSAVTGWPSFARTFCRSVSGGSCPPQVYRSAIFELSLAALATVATLTAVTLAARYGKSLRRAGRSTRIHAEAARITGRRFAAAGIPRSATAVVLDAPEPAVYCVPGHPATIVLTSGAVAILEPPQLRAVLAHERAHLSGRHHLLITLGRGLAATFGSVPLFCRGSGELARLTEMRADDVAARRDGRNVLLSALVAMATAKSFPVPLTSLAVTGGVVTARVHRLLEPPAQAYRLLRAVALIAVIIALTAVSLVLPAVMSLYSS